MPTPSYGCARCDKWAADWIRLRAERDAYADAVSRVRDLAQRLKASQGQSGLDRAAAGLIFEALDGVA